MMTTNTNTNFVKILLENKNLFEKLGFSFDTLKSEYLERSAIHAVHELFNSDNTEALIIEENTFGMGVNIGMAFDPKYSEQYRYDRFCDMLQTLFHVNVSIPDIFIESFVDALVKIGVFTKSDKCQPISVFDMLVQHGIDATCISNKSNIKLDDVKAQDALKKRNKIKNLKFKATFRLDVNGPLNHSWFSSRLNIVFKIGQNEISLDTNLYNSISLFESIDDHSTKTSSRNGEHVDINELGEKTKALVYKLMSAYLNQPINDLYNLDNEKIDSMLTLKEMEKI